MQALKPQTKTLNQRQTEAHIVKPAELIDIREISDGLTLADRRIYNLLLANAWDNIQEPVLHPIRLHELRSSNQDNTRPRDSLRRLMKVVVGFDVVEDGIKREVLTQLLGPCKLDHNPQGLAYYTFPEPIRAALESSSVFARLRRDLLCQFRSKYALSLYEMLQKRINLSFKTCEDFTVEDLRQKLGVEKGLYPAYQSLNLRVIKPAILEVNTLSDIECSIEPILEGRKTVGLRLSWRKKTADEAVKNAQALPKPGEGKAARATGPALRIVGNTTGAAEAPKSGKRLRELNTRECEQLKKTFSGYDIYYFYTEFQDWLETTGGEIPKNPAAAFTNWLKSYYKITGPRQR
jgi:Initiator Replication protein